MSIATQITRINTAKAGIKEVVNQDFEIIEDETITYYPEKIAETIEEYKKYIPKNTVEGTELDINDAAPISGKIAVKGNTYQKSRILPEGYTQVDYIQSYGREYIDTRVNADSNLRTILDMTFDDPTGSNQNVGAINLSSDGDIRYHILPTNGFFKIYVQKAATSFNTIALDTERHYYDIDVPNQTCKVDNNNYNMNTTEFDTQLNFWLFARNSTSTIYKCKNKLYKCKMYVSGVLVRDFIPCYRNSDNEVGLYDLVNDVFYTNDGNDAFTYGSVVDIPNPEYPQEIKVVTGNNVIKHIGKNWFNSEIETGDISYQTGNNSSSLNRVRTKDFIPVLPNKTYTLKRYIYSGKQFGLRFYDKNQNYLGFKAAVTSQTITFTTNEYSTADGTFNGEIYFIKFIDLENNLNATYQLELGPTATDYEQYQGKDFNLNLGTIELCKLGTYQDYFHKENNTWYKHKAVKKVVFNGTEEWTRYYNASRAGGFYIALADSVSGSPCLCDRFINDNEHAAWFGSVGTFRITDTLNASFKTTNAGIQPVTKEEWESYLTTNNLTLYYPLSEAVEEQITDTTLIAQLDALNNCKWFRGVNHWFTDTSNKEPVLKGTYRQAVESEVP